VCQWHRLPLTGSRPDISLVSYSGKTPTFCVFLYLAWRLWKSVLTLAVTRTTISGRVFRRSRMSVSQRHRRLLTEIDEIYGWQVAVQRRLTLCVFPVFSVAVMEKCCDACGDGEYYFRSSLFDVTGMSVCSEASAAVDRKSMSIRLVSYSGKTPDFVCISCI
jgi:hypothetical protein